MGVKPLELPHTTSADPILLEDPDRVIGYRPIRASRGKSAHCVILLDTGAQITVGVGVKEARKLVQNYLEAALKCMRAPIRR